MFCIQKIKKLVFSVLFLAISTHSFAQKQNSVLSTGTWIKLGVLKNGVYKLDANFLQSTGIELSAVNPQTIKIYGNGGGMLPQLNSAERPEGLIENAILIKGENDGTFDSGDYILFYAEGPDEFSYLPGSNSFKYQNNIYSDTSFYFLTYGGKEGKRIQERKNEGIDFPVLSTYEHFFVHEKDELQILSPGSGREWYGEKFDLIPEREFEFDIPGISSTGSTELVASVVGQAFGPAEFQLSLNGHDLGILPIETIPSGTYTLKGVNATDTFSVENQLLDLTIDQLRVTLNFQRNSTERSLGFLNFLFGVSERVLAVYDGQTQFRSRKSLNNSFSTFSVEGFRDDTRIWDITDSYNPISQIFDRLSTAGEFGFNSSTLREFIAFHEKETQAPIFDGKVPNQNLRGNGVSNLVIVTHPSLLNAAMRLANFRTAHDKLSVKVVTTEEVYNEFSSGRQDVTAIRDYMKFLYDQRKDEKGLKYLLLFGKGSNDYKDITANNANIVPIYESRNSLHPIFSYSSDDYYSFLDDHEGIWEETRNGDHLMDIGVGRIPAVNGTEASGVVDKLIHYGTSTRSVGPWRSKLVFVADDGDFNIHQNAADELASVVDTSYASFNNRKIYMDAFPQVSTPNGEEAPEVKKAIVDAINEGALVINFTGHGGETGWAQEDIFDLNTIQNLDNSDKMPLIITATCEFGRHDDPNRRSGAELLVVNPKGGAVALITTARPVFSNTNEKLNEALIETLFAFEDGERLRLGDIFRNTKNNGRSLQGPVNRNFSLLGDPSMRLSYPSQHVAITQLNGKSLMDNADTLKALELVDLKGEVRNFRGERLLNFGGKIDISVFDKASIIETLGNENPKTTFKQRDNVLFRGQASVEQGEFELRFKVPKNINFILDNGKISFYASDSLMDASGAEIDILVGASNPTPPIDNSPPVISLFMDDMSFKPGERTTPNPLLIANIRDENGINISNTGFGHEIIAALDDEREFILNDLFVAELDNFQSGWIFFPLEGLDKGKHQIRLRASDTHNNSSEETLEFFVSEDAKIILKDVINYPNPFSERTQFRFTHNRQGEDINVDIEIFSVKGEFITNLSENFTDSESTIDRIEWDGRNNKGEKVDDGIYIYKINVQSLTDASKNQTFSRLIIRK